MFHDGKSTTHHASNGKEPHTLVDTLAAFDLTEPRLGLRDAELMDASRRPSKPYKGLTALVNVLRLPVYRTMFARISHYAVGDAVGDAGNADLALAWIELQNSQSVVARRQRLNW
jgi:hypothetical protein